MIPDALHISQYCIHLIQGGDILGRLIQNQNFRDLLGQPDICQIDFLLSLGNRLNSILVYALFQSLKALPHIVSVSASISRISS